MYYCNDKVSYISHSILRKHNHQSDGIKVSAHQHSADFPRTTSESKDAKALRQCYAIYEPPKLVMLIPISANAGPTSRFRLIVLLLIASS